MFLSVNHIRDEGSRGNLWSRGLNWAKGSGNIGRLERQCKLVLTKYLIIMVEMGVSNNNNNNNYCNITKRCYSLINAIFKSVLKQIFKGTKI